MASITKRGNKYRVAVKVGEYRDTATFETKAKAKIWASEKEVALRQLSSGTSITHTLNDVFDRYAKQVSENKKGKRWEIVRLNKLSRDPIAKIKLVKLNSSHIQDWVDRRLEEVMSSSVNREMNLMSHVLTMARRWKLMSHNPFADIKRPKNPPHRDRRITEDEISRLCFALNYEPGIAPKEKQQFAAIAFLFAIETAMRAGEICALRPEWVEGSVAHLPETKNGLPRDVPLSSKALALLKELPDNDPLFNLTSATLSQFFRKAKGLAGIDDVTFHDSRHEAITRLADKLDVLDLARAVGHKDIRQLMTYYNKSAKDLAVQLG